MGGIAVRCDRESDDTGCETASHAPRQPARRRYEHNKQHIRSFRHTLSPPSLSHSQQPHQSCNVNVDRAQPCRLRHRASILVTTAAH